MAIRLHTVILAAASVLALSCAANAQASQPGVHFIENWDQDGDGRVLLEEIETMRGDLFASFDSDEDEILSPEEFDVFDAARNADLADQPEKARKVLQPVVDGIGREANDADGDGLVTRAEFIDGSTPWLEQFDKDGDGAMTSADFMAILKAGGN